MRNRSSIPILRGISIAILTIALVLTVIALIGYSRQRNNYPAGMTIGGVPVGGVDPQTASQRVLQVYSSPVELHYGEAVIQIEPSVVGFELDLDSMIAAAEAGTLTTLGLFFLRDRLTPANVSLIYMLVTLIEAYENRHYAFGPAG